MATKMRTNDFVFADNSTQSTATRYEQITTPSLAGATDFTTAVPSWTNSIEIGLEGIISNTIALQVNIGYNNVLITTGYVAGGSTYTNNACSNWTANYGFPFRGYNLASRYSGMIRLRKVIKNSPDELWACSGSITTLDNGGSGHVAGHVWLPNTINILRLSRNNYTPIGNGWAHISFSSI